MYSFLEFVDPEPVPKPKHPLTYLTLSSELNIKLDYLWSIGQENVRGNDRRGKDNYTDIDVEFFT